MKKPSLLLLLFFTSVLFSQDYRTGYYISNSGNKVEGEILDAGFDRDYINFKSNAAGNESKIDISNFKELTVGSDKYISVEAEYASNRLTESNRRIDNEPKMTSKRLLLKTLIEGGVTLYQGVIAGEIFYYIKTPGSDQITYLLYYKYPNADLTTGENTQYKRQLFQYLSCGDNSSFDKFYKIPYFENELKKVVNDYNICKGGVSNDVSKVNEKFKIKFSVFAGVKSQLTKFKSQQLYGTPESGSYVTPTFGLELSYLAPSVNRSFEVFFRASYDKVEYESNKDTQVANGVSIIHETLLFETNFLHFDLGPRYYFSGKSKSSFFIEAAFQYNVLIGDEFSLSYSQTGDSKTVMPTKSGLSLGAGIGYIYNRKYSINLGGSFLANYMQKNTLIENNSSSLNLNFKYTF